MKKFENRTYDTYKVKGSKIIAVVCGVHKTENAPNVDKILLKFMQAEIEKKD